jgi:hypothetical protein
MIFRKLLFLLILGIAYSAFAAPAGIVTIITDSNIPVGACIAIPRHKIWLDPTNPDHLIAIHGNDVANGGVFQTTDGGSTWARVGASQQLNYHASMAADVAGNIYLGSYVATSSQGYTDPWFRRWSGSAWETAKTFHPYSGGGTANVLVGNDNDVWVFTRPPSGDSTGVFWYRSTDNGANFGSGTEVSGSGSSGYMRVGSAMIGGQPAILNFQINTVAEDI